jgi:hypothetical protein
MNTAITGEEFIGQLSDYQLPKACPRLMAETDSSHALIRVSHLMVQPVSVVLIVYPLLSKVRSPTGHV